MSKVDIFKELRNAPVDVTAETQSIMGWIEKYSLRDWDKYSWFREMRDVSFYEGFDFVQHKKYTLGAPAKDRPDMTLELGLSVIAEYFKYDEIVNAMNVMADAPYFYEDEYGDTTEEQVEAAWLLMCFDDYLRFKFACSHCRSYNWLSQYRLEIQTGKYTGPADPNLVEDLKKN